MLPYVEDQSIVMGYGLSLAWLKDLNIYETYVVCGAIVETAVHGEDLYVMS
jgi:hypothetical protein